VARRIIKRALIGLTLAGAIAACWYHFFPQRQARTAPATSHTVLGWKAELSNAAGDGVRGFADGAPGLARLADPFGLAMDRAGNLYIADAGDTNRIRKLAPDGSMRTVAGGVEGFADGPAAQAAFNTPSGLAIDGAGNLYIADTGNNAIRKLAPDGTVSTVAGDGQAGYRDGAARQARFNGPIGVAVDARGNVLVADTYNDRIRLISADGQVRTLAGTGQPGYQDGPALGALFDTPCAIAINAQGELFIADTRNGAVRKLAANGQVSTLARSESDAPGQLLRRPLSLAMTPDGYLYVGDMSRGRIVQLSPKGELRGLTGVGIDVAVGDDAARRIATPAAIVLDKTGALYVSDPAAYLIRRVAPSGTVHAQIKPAVMARTTGSPLPWPLKPQSGWHEVVGTMGEVRGNYDGESRDHFHNGVDVQGPMGAPVLAVMDAKVSDPLPNWGHGTLTEGLAIDTMAYIHMRVGRSDKDIPFDPARFTVVTDSAGKVLRMRVKRGTRFHVGDTLGTVNRMYHVHLAMSQGGMQANPLALSFNGFADHIAPHIESIALFDQGGHVLAGKRRNRLLVPRAAGDISIVVGAYDQTDGNMARRRLGLYRLGYQVLRTDGTPVPGFEQPLVNVEFNSLPPDHETVKIAYAENSGETAHGNAATQFLYVVTNTVRDGLARAGSWHAQALPPGQYTLRILAADYAGNEALKGRDLAITIE
jgi:sugar lactone lactonase YvrE